MTELNLTQEFQNVVESVFNSWTALQLAIANDSGGRQTREKLANMIDYITRLICEYDNVDSDEIANTLHEMMDENFQTICEDNSPEEVGSVLCDYFLKYKAGEKDKVDAELGIVKKIYSTSQSVPLKSEDTEMSADEGSETPVSQVNSLPSDNVNMECESEWTVVKSKRRM